MHEFEAGFKIFENIHTNVVRKWANSSDGQIMIARFIDEVLRPKFSTSDGYKEICRLAEQDVERFFKPENYLLFHESTSRYTEVGPPGHGKGHSNRDRLASDALLVGDPALNVALFPELRKCSPSNYKYVKYNSDAIAGKLAGETHDIGNSLMHRFADKNMFAGHPEIGAALVWYFAKDIFGDHLALLIAWAVAAHQHLTKPLKIGEYTRDTYPVEIFEVGREIVGIAPVIARFCDRLDTGGGISQLPRTFTSRADSVEEGVDGHDVVPGSNEDMKFFEINRANLTAKFWPIIRPKEEQKEGDSIVEHLLMYCGSSTGITVYSENDYRFPLAQQLMLERVVESKEILNLMVNLPRRKANPEEEEKAKELFKNFLLKSMVSNQGDFGRIWRLLEEIWDEQTPETKYVWFATLPKMDAEYDRWIKRLYQVVVDSGYWLAEFSGEVVKEMLST